MKSKVLIVDDNADIRRLIRVILNRDYLLEEASDGKQALSKIAVTHFDCVISDIEIPGITGLELSRRIRKSHPGTKVILMSASTTDLHWRVARECGTHYFLPKPFPIHELLKAVGS